MILRGFRGTQADYPKICAFVGLLCFIVQGCHGLDRHYQTMTAEDTQVFNELSFFQTLFSPMTALGLLKNSIAFCLLRLSTSKWHSRSLWGLIGFVVFYTVLAWFTLLLQCQPVNGF